MKPEDIDGLAFLGSAHYQLGNYEAGLEYFNRLVRLDEENGRWYLYRGIYFFKKRDLKDAEGQLKFALDLNPSLYTAHYYLGKIYEERGESESALEELKLYRQNMSATVGKDADEPAPGILIE